MLSFLNKHKNLFYNSFVKYGINTPLRIAHFLAQLAHESARFTADIEKISYEKAQANYQNHKYLGNKLAGDGYRFRGRGLIQLTGRANYEAYKKYSGVDIVTNPDLARRIDISIDIACWYWSKRNINQHADKDDVTAVTKKINGGTNGLKDRIEKTQLMKNQSFTLDWFKKKTVKPKPTPYIKYINPTYNPYTRKINL